MNIAIPFNETEVSPGKVCDTYINIPNKKRLIKITIRPTTNCNCLFLNRKIAINDTIADNKNKIGTIFCKIESALNKSKTNTSSSDEFVHKLNTTINPLEIIVANNK